MLLLRLLKARALGGRVGEDREGREGLWRGKGVVDGWTRIKTYWYQVSIPTFRHGLFLPRYGLVGAEVPGYYVAVIV